MGVLLLAFHTATLLTHLLTTCWPFVSLKTEPARLGSLAIGALFLLAHPGEVVGTAAGVFLATLDLQYLRNNLKARTQISVSYLAWGHLVGTLGILVLAFSPAPWPALLAWTITGFGGGTIFMLSRLRAANPYDPAAMDLWDNGANIVGLLLFRGFWGRGAPMPGFFAAAAVALVAALAAAGLQDVSHRATAEQLSDLVQSRAKLQG